MQEKLDGIARHVGHSVSAAAEALVEIHARQMQRLSRRYDSIRPSPASPNSDTPCTSRSVFSLQLDTPRATPVDSPLADTVRNDVEPPTGSLRVRMSELREAEAMLEKEVERRAKAEVEATRAASEVRALSAELEEARARLQAMESAMAKATLHQDPEWLDADELASPGAALSPATEVGDALASPAEEARDAAPSAEEGAQQFGAEEGVQDTARPLRERPSQIPRRAVRAQPLASNLEPRQDVPAAARRVSARTRSSLRA